MALIWLEHPVVESGIPESSEPFSWDKWYAQNKARLAEKRAKRYRDDPAYREAALKRSREQRTKEKAPVTDGTTVSFRAMAEALNVTPWVLREWRRKNYFPEPVVRDGRLWFTPEQETLLQRLVSFFGEHGTRLDGSTQLELESLVASIFANWW